MPVIGSLRFRDVACRHVDCANIAFSNRSGLNTNPLLDSVGVRPLIDQYVYCLTTTFSFPLQEGDKLAPSTQMEAPPQSLHVLLTRLCSQMEAPPQSLHWVLRRLCSQMEAPPQSLHLFL